MYYSTVWKSNVRMYNYAIQSCNERPLQVSAVPKQVPHKLVPNQNTQNLLNPDQSFFNF
jgi:hypothetical protein